MSDYLPYTINKDTAIIIAKMLYNSINHTMSIENYSLDDFDYWYGISKNWDVNIWIDEVKLHCTLYPVINGLTDVTRFISVR